MKRMGALRSNAALEGLSPFPVRFRWKDTLNVLEELAAAEEGDPFDGVVLDFTDPFTGGPTTATIGCRIQMLRPGKKTQPPAHV